MRSDSVIRKAKSWSDLFSRLEHMTPKVKGDVFERVIQLFLQTNPEYETQLANVWLLSEVPKHIRTKLNLPELDEGIDLIAETFKKKYWGIQEIGRAHV